MATSENPYLVKMQVVLRWNPAYDPSALCTCNHHYERHFDTYDDMEPVGCKYCSCRHFVERRSE